MKKLQIIVLGIAFGCGITSCTKDTVTVSANFNLDKSSYYAGDVVHLSDASINAKSWKWTMPNGQIYTTQNVDYMIDTNDIGGTKTFKLEIADGPKTDTISKSVLVSQKILPSDYFIASGHTSITPTIKYSYVSGNFWVLNATHRISSDDFYVLEIYFPGPFAPTAGTYSLQVNPNTLTIGKASILIYLQPNFEVNMYYHSTSGQLVISYSNNGELHAVFNNVPANGTISGDITIR